MGNDEDEEPREAEIPRARMTPKSHMSRGKQGAVIGVLFVSKVEELVDNIEINWWRKTNEKERLRLLLLTTVS